MNDSLTQLQNLIKEGKTLVQIRPSRGSTDLNGFSGDEAIENQAICYKWFIKSLNLLEELFTKNSGECKIFASFYIKYQLSNLIGTRHIEASFLKDDMLMQISHLEAIEEILKNNIQKDINLNNSEFQEYLMEKNWVKPLWWKFNDNVKRGYCPVCKKPRTDSEGNIPGSAFIGGICYKCFNKLESYNNFRFKCRGFFGLKNLKILSMNPWIYGIFTAVIAGIILYLILK